MNTAFQRLVELVSTRSPLQRKKIEKHLSSRGQEFFDEAESSVGRYLAYLDTHGIPLDDGVGAYLGMCKDYMVSQVHFQKTGKYPTASGSDVHGEVYGNQKKMQAYMIGLALSQYLWATHYEMFSFFSDYLRKFGRTISSYLEVGPGHGLYLTQAIKEMPKDGVITAIDISQTSLDITKSIVDHFYGTGRAIEYICGDATIMDFDRNYSFITIGEVIEHLEDPVKMLKSLRNSLSKDGKIFVSTCVNCPMIDHLYHFHTVDEIREVINAAGLSVEDEKILPTEDLPMDEIISRKITINYCAICVGM